MAQVLEGIHLNADWPLGYPWVDETLITDADASYYDHIEALAAGERVGHFAYGVGIERTHNGITEVWPLSQPTNPFLTSPA